MNQGVTGDLGNVFGPAAAGSLSGKLPRITNDQERSPQAEQQPRPEAEPEAAPKAAPEAEPEAAPASRAARQREPQTMQISVYVRPHVPPAVRAAKRGRSNAAVVYDAIEAAADRLGDLVGRRHAAEAAEPPTTGGGLFQRSRRDVREPVPQRVIWTFKTTADNRAVLDQLVTTYGASSRSELVSVALEDQFTPTV